MFDRIWWKLLSSIKESSTQKRQNIKMEQIFLHSNTDTSRAVIYTNNRKQIFIRLITFAFSIFLFKRQKLQGSNWCLKQQSLRSKIAKHRRLLGKVKLRNVAVLKAKCDPSAICICTVLHLYQQALPKPILFANTCL